MNPLGRLRKKILAEVLNFLKEQDGLITDDFPTKLTDCYLDFAQQHKRLPDLHEFLHEASKVRTRFFRENHGLRKTEVLGGIVERLERSLGDSRDLKYLFAPGDRIFISHSNIFPHIYGHFASVIRSVGYEPVIAEKTLNYGRSWNPGQKAETLMRKCSMLVAVITPDDPQTRLPRLNVGHEIGLAQGLPIPVVFLKAREAELPSGIRPVYISFTMDHPEEADVELISNIRSVTRLPPG